MNITGVRVLDEDGNEVTTGITINLDGNTAVITGLQDNYTVEWTAPGHDGVLIEEVAGKYDLGKFNIVSANANSEFVGQQIVIEDDGPAASGRRGAGPGWRQETLRSRTAIPPTASTRPATRRPTRPPGRWRRW